MRFRFRQTLPAPQPPVVKVSVNETISEGQVVTVSGQFNDPDEFDKHILRWVVTASNGQVIADGLGQVTLYSIR